MFSTRLLRPAQQLSSHVRRYASQAPQSNNNLLYVGLGTAALGGAGYYFLPQKVAQEAVAVIPKKEEIKQVSTTPAPKCFTGGDQGFVSLALESVSNINSNTKQFRFKLPESDQVSGLAVASALITKYKGPDMEKPAIRPYTPVSDEDLPGYLDLIIKSYPNGVMSQHIFSMQPGDTLEMKGPIPKFPWTTNKHAEIALIAGGTGITPMYQLARGIFNNPEDKTKVSLIFGNLTEEDILLKKEFDELEQKFPQRFRAFYVLDNPPENWQQGKGHITKELLKTIVPGPEQKDVKLFVCGPPGLVNAISGPKKSPSQQGELGGMLKELGYTEENVYKF